MGLRCVCVCREPERERDREREREREREKHRERERGRERERYLRSIATLLQGQQLLKGGSKVLVLSDEEEAGPCHDTWYMYMIHVHGMYLFMACTDNLCMACMYCVYQFMFRATHAMS